MESNLDFRGGHGKYLMWQRAQNIAFVEKERVTNVQSLK